MAVVERTRQVHLVGTIPAEDTRDALRLVLDTVGDRVADWLPDGETGNRSDWITRLVQNLDNHPDLERSRDGDWSDYESTPSYRVKKGHSFDSVELDYYENFTASWPEFKVARDELHRTDLAFQVGIPGPLDVAFASFGFNPIAALRNVKPFEDATVSEIRRIHEVAGDEVVYQIEIPIELEVLLRMPAAVRAWGVRWLARRVLRIVGRSPEGTRWGFHICVGDMNHKAFSQLKDSGPAVLLANKLAALFPSGRTLEFVHMPFAHADVAPVTEPAFYAPLSGLDLPDSVTFVAGFVHETQDDDTQEQIRAMIESHVGAVVDVAAACGLGRRNRELATSNLELSRRLTG